MPRRKDKGTDTEQSDSYQINNPKDAVQTFGTITINRYLPPDELPEDDPSRYNIRSWANVLQAQRLLQWPQRRALFQRAVKCLPNCYKIWLNYLSEFMDYCSNRSLFSRQYNELNNLFEASLKYLPKMPRIWIMYAECLAKQNLISKARFVYNWSFKNLPLTQHEKVWAKFAPWVLSLQNPKTAIEVIPRYLKLNPDYKEIYATYLMQRKQWNLSAKVLHDILLDEGYNSKSGKSKYDFFTDLVNVIISEPVSITSVNGVKLLEEGIMRYPEECGSLWVRLSDYFIRLGEFEQARLTLEKALNTINSAKDFGLVFNAYCKFEEEMINALANKDIREKQGILPEDLMDAEVELRLSKLQKLIERRPYLLYNINLRKNPNDVKTWLALIDLHKKAGNLQECFNTIQRCNETVKSDEAQNGRYSEIWIYAAKLYQQLRDLPKCSDTFFAATQVNYKTIEDYINVWTRWAEVLIEEGYPKDALAVVKHVLFRRKIDADNLKIKNIDEILKSNALIWELYIDIELQIGTFETSKMAYNRCKQHRSLTPLMLLNYINMLWGNAYFQEVFRVFEFAVGHFKWPNVYEIWLSYISRFIQRYGSDGVGVERTRSIFQRLLKEVPQERCKIFYFMYAEFEEQYGLFSHAVEILDRMVNAVKPAEKYDCYSIYIAKVAALLGITKTRAIFEAALQKLAEDEIIKMAMKYAELEKNLGEIDRSRAVYIYASQFTDPKDDSEGLWALWEGFEVQFGNKDTYKEYLRIKRSVMAKFSMLPPDIRKIQDKVNKGLV